MKVFSAIDDIRQERWVNPEKIWGLVPTMGFLHEGHLSLVRKAREENEKIGVSIFVNPIQFNDPEDLATYPTDLQRDLDLLKMEGVDLVWTPAAEIVYPTDFQTHVEVERVSLPLEGKKRPGHFRGVATVVAKLFNVFQPHRAYFGQKDAQQVAVIKQMTKDLNFNTEIVTCPTVRETDGLALSSRNAKLSAEGRRQAICLYRALTAAKKRFENGEYDAGKLKEVMLNELRAANLARVEYVSIADTKNLKELSEITDKALASLAVFIGDVRLIDNMILDKNEEG